MKPENIRIVLVNTSHPGNIGSVARAMKTMGLSQLYLVDPLLFPHPKATELASAAADVLDQAVVVKTLDEAIADCTLVFGTSTRTRTIPWPVLSPRQSAELTMKEPQESKIAILFGREQSGLTNEELHSCHYHIQIPSNPEYSSLNIAAAVQVICYELRVAMLGDAIPEQWDFPLAGVSEMEGFFEHFERVLVEMKFLDPKAPRQLMRRIRRLFQKARPDVMEVNIMRGILGAVAKLVKND